MVALVRPFCIVPKILRRSRVLRHYRSSLISKEGYAIRRYVHLLFVDPQDLNTCIVWCTNMSGIAVAEKRSRHTVRQGPGQGFFGH
jgi:hypothetical protein